jgi:hypothetical protein
MTARSSLLGERLLDRQVTNPRRRTAQPTDKIVWSRNWDAPDPVPDYAIVLASSCSE